MVTIIGLISSALLQVVAAISALWLLRASRAKIAWIMIFIAFMFMAFRRIVEVVTILHGSVSPGMSLFSNWLGIIVSAIMAVAVIMIGRILFTLKRAEAAGHELETRFTTLFHNSSDEIYLADLRGNLIEANQVACETLGYSRQELLQKNFKDLKTPKYFDTVEPNLKKIIENGRHVYETEHVSKDGKVISLEVKSRVINYLGQEAIISIARETTERKQMERNILSAVIRAEEQERERISKDIHDGLGPLLSTIKLYVNELESGDMEPEEKTEMLKQTNELINEAISSTRSISNNLSPHLVMDFGLVKAVDSFCKKVNLAQKIRINFENTLGAVRFDQTIEIVLYRVITELINNTLKHANASKIDIYLEIIEEVLQLTYLDDGVGFDKDKAMNDESGGMGLKNIVSRLRSINGNYRIHSRPGAGFLVVVEISLNLDNVSLHRG
ncbi:MAG: PAS domain S-box protein [Bacteroidales bacterium]|jgi:PAS domain S-box-containing protein|nr:PAS domain S-box protein [Bacteroidales bacterium]